eukprot:CAMPEP_0180628554 /NCGR_PEP_ID=MMETSP1037_2-20121125/38993_1 /TAXON_ID=632150 /ORGANISM="Azadinium spinosum, Strain 3D9" /LENGTH=194 /DNA_ID=CAMNT_0022649303 /DNA_START=235 /DNA_END=819 /DNA_ORIENTATION=-
MSSLRPHVLGPPPFPDVCRGIKSLPSEQLAPNAEPFAASVFPVPHLKTAHSVPSDSKEASMAVVTTRKRSHECLSWKSLPVMVASLSDREKPRMELSSSISSSESKILWTDGVVIVLGDSAAAVATFALLILCNGTGGTAAGGDLSANTVTATSAMSLGAFPSGTASKEGTDNNFCRLRDDISGESSTWWTTWG